MWSGESACEIDAPIHGVWAFLGHFYAVTSWMPLTSCTDETGRYETQVGCMRTLRRVGMEEEDEEQHEDVMAALETEYNDFDLLLCEHLISYHPDTYSFSYVVEEINLGLRNFYADVQVWEGSSPDSCTRDNK